MSFLRFEDEQVDCYCFNERPGPNRSGLKPADTMNKYQNPKIDRQAYSSDMKRGGKSQVGKTSLRRQKCPTPEQSKISWKPSKQLMLEHQKDIFKKKQEIIAQNMTIPMPINFHAQTLRLQTNKNFQQPQKFNISDQPKTVSQIRSFYAQSNSLQREKKYFNVPTSIVYAQPGLNKAPIRNSKISLNSLQKIQELPLHQISEMKDKNSHKFLSPRKDSPNNTLRQSSWNKRTNSEHKNRISLTPREYPPNRLHLKEIESVIDDSEKQDDEISEVIGRGWDNREEDFSPACKQKLKTETMGTSASHIKNSETGNSVFGISESVMRWA